MSTRQEPPEDAEGWLQAFPGLLFALVVIAEGGFQARQNLRRGFEQCLKARFVDLIHISPGMKN